MKKNKGAATLLIAVMLMLSTIIIALYSGQISMGLLKTTSNLNSRNQSFEAAEAGLEYAIAYLNQNTSTILASPSGGYISYGPSNGSLTDVTLSNNSAFSVVYTNPTANDYNVLLITVTGRNADSSSTTTVQQKVAQQPSQITTTISSVGNISLVGGSSLRNTVTNMNIMTGGTVTINNGAQTYTSSGLASYQGRISSDIQQNMPSLQGMSQSAYFQSIFGASSAAVQATAQASGLVYTNQSADYSQRLSGVTGKTIFINQTNGTTVTLGQGVTIGSAAQPVTIIVIGNLTIANGVTIYGFVYASSPTQSFNLAGGARVFGGLASATTMNISNGFQLIYNKFPIIAGGSAYGAYGKLPGTWKDF